MFNTKWKLKNIENKSNIYSLYFLGSIINVGVIK